LAAFFIGLKTRKFIFLILDFFIGLGAGILSVILYFKFTPPLSVGLGIIALVPAMIVLFSGLNSALALVGGVVGTLIGKRSAKKKHKN